MIDLVAFIPRAMNLGIPGVMYVGGICGVIGSFNYEQACGGNLNGFLAIFIPIICSLVGSLLMGLLYCFLTVSLRANQNVTGLAMTTFGVGIGNFFGGSLIKLAGADVPSIALTKTSKFFKTALPGAASTGWFGKIFLSYGFLAYTAVIIALVTSYIFKHTRMGLHLRSVGESPATADAAGINVTKYKYFSTCLGCMIAGLGGLYYVMDCTRHLLHLEAGLGYPCILPLWRPIYSLSLYSDRHGSHGSQGALQDAALHRHDGRSRYYFDEKQA